MSYRTAVNIFFLVNGFVYANWAARIPAMQEQHDLDNIQIGFILLAHSIGAFIAMPVTGFLISKYSSRKVTFASGVAFPFFFVMLPWSQGFLSLLIPFLLMGSATGMMDVAMNAQAVQIEKILKKPIMTMFHALFSIGMVIGGLLGSLAINQGWSLSTHFPIVFLISLTTLVFAGKYLYPDPQSYSSKEPWFILPKGPLVILGIIAFCCMMGEGAIADWSTIYMKEIVQSPTYLYAMGLTAFAALMTSGRLVGDQVRKRIRDRKILILGALLSIAGMLFTLLIDYPIIVIIGFGIVGLGLSNIVPIIYSLAGNMKKINPGVGIAMATTIGYSGFMIGPPLIGFIADASSLYYSMILLSVLFLLMFILIRSKA